MVTDRLRAVELLARAGFWFAILPLLKRVVPLQRLVRWMFSPKNRNRDPQLERAVVKAVERTYRLRKGGICLDRSLTLYRLLTRAGASPELNIGFTRRNSEIVGHAWVMLDGTPIFDSPDSVWEFDHLVAFGRDGLPLKDEPPAGESCPPRHA